MGQEEACERCGFTYLGEVPTRVENWPQDLPPPPPLPPTIDPHPRDLCCSPFARGEELFWDLAMEQPDLPPLRVTFLELTGLEGPFFHLEAEEWIQDSLAVPLRARVEVRRGSPFAEALTRGELPANFEVAISELTAVDLWPALDCDEPPKRSPEAGHDSLAESLARITAAEDDLACGCQVPAFEAAWSAALGALTAVYERFAWPLPPAPRSRALCEVRYPPVEPLLEGLASRFPTAGELARRAGGIFEGTWGIAAIAGACPSEWFCEDADGPEALRNAVELARRIVSLCEKWIA